MDLFSFSPRIFIAIDYKFYFNSSARSFILRARAHFLRGNRYLLDARLCNDVQYWVLATLILAAFILCDDDAVTTGAADAVDVVTVIVAMLANNQLTKYINECI